MDLELLDRTLAAHGEPAYRAAPGVGVGGGRRELLRGDVESAARASRGARRARCRSRSLAVEARAHSSDGTEKALFATADGRPVEAVLMRYRDGRRSLCLSSQSGCPLTCTFCATGSMSFGRNLLGLGDPRPGASLPPHRARQPDRVHGHGRAADEPRRRARGLRAAAGDRGRDLAHDDLHRRLAARDRAARARGAARAPGALAARRPTTRFAPS